MAFFAGGLPAHKSTEQFFKIFVGSFTLYSDVGNRIGGGTVFLEAENRFP